LDDNLLITEVDVLSILLAANTTLILLNKISSGVEQVYGATETAAQGDLSG
jgi:nitrogen fixation/metabolism regulation signal transduction histidine kinase